MGTHNVSVSYSSVTLARFKQWGARVCRNPETEIDAADLYGDGSNLGEMLVADTSAREAAAEPYACLLAEPKQHTRLTESQENKQ